MKAKVLIVDDEEAVLKALAGALKDEGFEVIVAHNGKEALRLFEVERPDVVLLDVWMPDMDGLEVLSEIRKLDANCPVVMISGHATVATAVKAMKLGANDFLEKPLSIDALLSTIESAIWGKEVREGSTCLPSVSFKASEGETFVPQRTLAKSAVLYGTGLHLGHKTGMILIPQPPNTGILFYDLAEDTVIPGLLDFVASTDFATSLGKNGVQIRTIEHLMATLHAYGVTNLLVKVHGEVPVMDGSALEFCRLLDEVGVKDQDAGLEEIRIEKRYEIRNGERSIIVEPAEHFEVEFVGNYPDPIGVQSFRFVLKGSEDFKEQIAPARTFAFLKDIEKLSKIGLAGGGHLHNVVLLDERGVINTELRFPDELVRHKVLDLIGDFYLLNRPLRARVKAYMTGHRENIAVLRAIKEDLGL